MRSVFNATTCGSSVSGSTRCSCQSGGRAGVGTAFSHNSSRRHRDVPPGREGACRASKVVRPVLSVQRRGGERRCIRCQSRRGDVDQSYNGHTRLSPHSEPAGVRSVPRQPGVREYYQVRFRLARVGASTLADGLAASRATLHQYEYDRSRSTSRQQSRERRSAPFGDPSIRVAPAQSNDRAGVFNIDQCAQAIMQKTRTLRNARCGAGFFEQSIIKCYCRAHAT